MTPINDNIASGLEVLSSLIPSAGDGLFAIEDKLAGVPLCEYKGDLLTKDELNERYGRRRAHYAYFHPYVGLYIDSHPSESIKPIGLGGFINDRYTSVERPDPPCLPREDPMRFTDFQITCGYNAALRPAAWDRTGCLVFSYCGIKAGDEIYLDYGKSYWE